MSRIAWKTLSSGEREGLLLAVDFAAGSRAPAQFADLAPLLEPPLTLWASRPPGPDDQVPPTGNAYLDWWLGEVRASGAPVDAVLGYCAGGVFAAALAERIADWQPAPRLILLDPELPATSGLYDDFHTAGDSLAALLTPAELDAFHARGEALEAQYGDDRLPVAGRELADTFTAAVAAAADRLDLDEDIRDELSGAFVSLVSYLTAATTLSPLPAWSTATALTTTAPDQPVGREERIAVAHDDLLRSAETARALQRLLAETPVPTTGKAG
ncbi:MULTISPECIES: alpha/beta hydrolase family protein [Streptomyces]|uniref:hypothetical protein n=1 Tax=Streptomyces TaxID=1883 RepID=UPI002931A6E9|nr:hypothetical protein [Streptomyces sp. NEAU-HV9]